MKEYLNRKEYPNGDITIKLVKMGCDIDEENNHRVRGIVPTDDGKQLFIEVGDAHRFDKSHFKDMSKEEYLKKYPYENYLWCDFCFRVDIPKDYYRNYSHDIESKKSYHDIEYDKAGIIKFLQKYNKHITDIELVDKNYIDEFNDINHFYKLYDERLEHTLEPIKIIHKTPQYASIEVFYKCTNYDNTSNYEELMTHHNYKIEHLYEIFGKEKMDTLFEEYDRKLNELKATFSTNQEKEL